jgi:Domain of unknown function (DUF4156)
MRLLNSNSTKIIFLSFLILASCKSAIDVTPGSERIRIFDSEPKGCLYVGEVASIQDEQDVGTLETKMELATRVDLRNKAYSLGGNVLVFLKGKRTNTLPGSAADAKMTPLKPAEKTATTAGAKSADAAKVDAASTSNENVPERNEDGKLVFLGTVFKCPSSIVNQ